jgi:hypothetical protein
MRLLASLCLYAVLLAGLLLPAAAPAQSPSTKPLPPGISLGAEVNPEKVVVGDRFEYSAIVNGNANIEAWKDPDLLQLKGLRIVMGPESINQMTIDRGRSVVVNRRRWQMEATEVGEFTIPSSQVKINGVYYETGAVKVIITDVPQLDQDLGSVLSARTQQPEINRQLQGNYFAKVEIPEKVYRGQAVPVDVYIYRTQKLPEFVSWQPQDQQNDDFIRPDVRDPRMMANRLNWETVKLGDHEFLRALLFTQYVIPTKTGKLKLLPPSLTTELPVVQRNTGQLDDVFDMMMARRTITAAMPMRPLEVEVLPLPDKPGEALMQVVGRAKVDVKVDRDKLPQRELLTLTITVSGEGFFDLLTQPKPLDLPNFAFLDSKTSSRRDMIKGLLFSEKKFEYVYQASQAGEATIPAMSFALFNPKAEAGEEPQVLQTSDALKVVVEAAASDAVLIGGGAGSGGQSGAGGNKADARVLGSDVAYIDARPLSAAAIAGSQVFYLRPWFWSIQLVPFLGSLGFGLYAVWRRNRKGESDAERAKRGRRAAGEALKAARAKLSAGSRDEFYATLANGMLEYVASLLGRSAKGLIIEEAMEALQARGYSADAIGRLSDMLERCDAIRYSPAPDSPEVRELAIGGAESILVELTSEVPAK